MKEYILWIALFIIGTVIGLSLIPKKELNCSELICSSPKVIFPTGDIFECLREVPYYNCQSLTNGTISCNWNIEEVKYKCRM